MRWTRGGSVQGEGTSGVQGAEGGCMGMQEIVGCEGRVGKRGQFNYDGSVEPAWLISVSNELGP